MSEQVQNKQGKWVDLDEIDGMTPEKLAELKQAGKYRVEESAVEPPESMATEASQKQPNQITDFLKNEIPWQKAGETAAEFIAPVSSANAQRIIDNGGNPESLSYMPSRIGAGLADGALLVASPIRAGITAARSAKAAYAASKAASRAIPKVSSKTAQKIVQGSIGAADNVANAALTNTAEGIAGGKEQEHSALNYGIVGGIGGALGGRAVGKSIKAQNELAGSVPQNIRLNERTGRIAEDGVLGIGSSKNDNSIELAEQIFSNPNKSLSQAIDENAMAAQKILNAQPSTMPSNLRVETDFIPPDRNLFAPKSESIDLSRTEILADMQSKGYIDDGGLNASKLQEARDYLNNLINWNKNEQGLARSAADEKAAREIYAEINKAMDSQASKVPEFKAKRDWDRDFSANKTEADLLTGISDKRFRRQAGTDYYPMRNINPVDYGNTFLTKEQAAMLASQRMPNKVFGPEER
jgi:hypothetical protein